MVSLCVRCLYYSHSCAIAYTIFHGFCMFVYDYHNNHEFDTYKYYVHYSLGNILFQEHRYSEPLGLLAFIKYHIIE
jgi:hypothetical protein